MGTLSSHERRRLAAVLGMLGSASAGERDNAARLAEDFRNQHGLTWETLLALPPAPAERAPFCIRDTIQSHGVTAAYALCGIVLICYGLIHD